MKVNVRELKQKGQEALEDLYWSKNHSDKAMIKKVEAEMASLEGQETVLRWLDSHCKTMGSQPIVASWLRQFRVPEASKGYDMVVLFTRSQGRLQSRENEAKMAYRAKDRAMRRRIKALAKAKAKYSGVNTSNAGIMSAAMQGLSL